MIYQFRTILLTATIALWFVPGIAWAALEVNFAATPLFRNADIKPGDSVSRTVTVTNTGSESQSVIVDLTNTFSDGLADVMSLSIERAGTVFAADDFSTLFGVDPIALDELTAGEAATYTFTASLPATVGNAYQQTTLGFDVVIGFAGGETTSDVTRTFGRGGGGETLFSLFNERVMAVATNSATIAWNTNRGATSYLVCGNLARGPYDLDPADELFGYAFAVPEITTDTEVHRRTVPNLAPGEYECRPASRLDTEDEFLVGQALRFTIAAPTGLIEGAQISQPPSDQPMTTGSVLGMSKAGGMSLNEYKEDLANLPPLPAGDRDAAPFIRDGAREYPTVGALTAESVFTYRPLVLSLGIALLLFAGWVLRRFWLRE